MKKKMSAILIATVFIAAMVGVTVAMAIGPPSACDDGTYFITPYIPDDGPFPRPYDGTFDANDPVTQNCEGAWIWEYEITSPDSKAMSNITKMHVYIPSTPPNTIELVYPNNERGVGATSTGKMYGNGIYNGVVVSLTPLSGVSNGKIISFCTDVQSYGTISIGVETARTLTGCESTETDTQGPIGGIIGPGFLPSPNAAFETDKIVQLGSDPIATVCAKKHPLTGCVKYFYKCADTSQAPLPSQSGPPAGFGDIIDMGDFEDPLCREAVFGTKNTPITYWGKAGGTYYCIGVYNPDVSPATWTQPCP